VAQALRRGYALLALIALTAEWVLVCIQYFIVSSPVETTSFGTSMTKMFLNTTLLSRFDELISEGEVRWQEFQKNESQILMDIVGFAQWSTSCLNLLDKLSISTNRFVTQFEVWAVGGPGKKMNIGGALGVLKSARHEYSCGLAIEYQLSVSAVVFSGLLDEATYLLEKGYHRAAAVLLGAALEEGLKARARAVPLVLSSKETLTPVINKLKAPEVRVLTEFEAKRLESIAKLRNDAAHGGEFNYDAVTVETAIKEVEAMLGKLLSAS
jgi:hypothetical protein